MTTRWLASTIVLASVHGASKIGVIIAAVEAVRGHVVSSGVWLASTMVLYVGERVFSALHRYDIEARVGRAALHAVFAGELFELPTTHPQSLLLSGVRERARLVGEVAPSALGDTVAAIVAITTAMWLGYAASLGVFLLCALGGMALVVALRRRVLAASQRAWTVYESHAQRLLDGLNGATEIVASGRSQAYEEGVAAGFSEWRRASQRVAVESVALGRLPVAVGLGFSVVIAHALGALPTSSASWALAGSVLPPFVGLATAISTYFQVAGPSRELQELLERPERRHGREAPKQLALALNDVGVDYGGAVAVEAASLETSGGLAVLVGPNGSGKSSLLRVIVGLLSPARGAATIGGVSWGDLDWTRVRERMAYLPQRPYLPLGATVREALAFVCSASDDRFVTALERIGVRDALVAKAGDALDAHVDELSAGQRQRVAIARVLARDAEVYVLDEPDANLDREGVDRLCKILEELSKRATVVVAAHTPEVVAIADQVVELDRGRVVRRETRRNAVNEASRVDSRA